MIRAHALFWWSAATVVAMPGCRQKPPEQVTVADDEATPGQAEALASLSPPWTPPDRAVLDNQLLTHWLVEKGRLTAHVRFVFPTAHLEPKRRGTQATLVAETIGYSLDRRLRRFRASIDVTHRPGRIEVAIHAPDANLESILKSAALVLARPPRREVEAMHMRMVDQAPPLTTEARAVSAFVAKIVGHDPESEQFDPLRLVELDADTLIETWNQLASPAHAALIVHAARSLHEPELTTALDVLTKRWREPVKLGEAPEPLQKIHKRLNIPVERPELAGGRLMAEGTKPPPLWHVEPPEDDPRTKPTLLLARVIATETAEDRSRLRLAQRMLQEQYDVSVTISGSQALCLVRIPIKKGRVPKMPWQPVVKDDKDNQDESDPRREFVYRSLEAIHSIIQRKQPITRLYQAAELWLGARMVRASLAGEDWTALWSDALDLSTRERDVVGALARDAKAMLTTTPEQLVQWQANWLDFKAGKPGWQWMAIGKKSDIRPLLRPFGAKLVKLEVAGNTGANK